MGGRAGGCAFLMGNYGQPVIGPRAALRVCQALSRLGGWSRPGEVLEGVRSVKLGFLNPTNGGCPFDFAETNKVEKAPSLV